MTIEEDLLQLARTTMLEAGYCFLITQDKMGRANARIMQPFEPENNMTVLFGTSPRSRKVQEILKNPDVTLAYFDPGEITYVTLIGTAKIEKDIHHHWSRWGERMNTFFPEGPESEDYIMIEFVPSRIEILSFTHAGVHETYQLRPDVLLRIGDEWVVEESGDNSEEEL